MPRFVHDLRARRRLHPRLSMIMAVVAVMAALLMFLDLHLAGKAEELYGQAHRVAAGQIRMANMQRDVHKGWVIVRAHHVPAFVCYAFTGGVHFSVLLPRSLRIQAEHPTVSSANGSCRPGDVNTLVFTFSEEGASPR